MAIYENDKIPDDLEVGYAVVICVESYHYNVERWVRPFNLNDRLAAMGSTFTEARMKAISLMQDDVNSLKFAIQHWRSVKKSEVDEMGDTVGINEMHSNLSYGNFK